jgi:hypothetical protein
MAEASSPPSFDPRLARVVKIKIADTAGEAVIGTGYLVAPGLVLTARHVLWRDGKETNGDHPPASLRVRAATGPRATASLPVSKAILLGTASGVDVAALVVPGLEPVAGTVVIGARFTTSQMVPGCWMIGYPRAAHRDSSVGAEYVGVSLLPVSGTVGGRIAVRVDTARLKRGTNWQGLSGSGVVDAQNRLLGILVDVQVKWHDRLAVVPVQAIAIAASEQVRIAPELAPLLEMPVVEESGEDPLFDHSKFPPRLDDLEDESLFEALHFRNRVVPFIDEGGRGAAVETALDWIKTVVERPEVKVAVVTGRAGVGKSRLAAEICDRLSASDRWWRAGFADHDKILTAPVPVVPTVVVVDYPERHPEAVGAFLTKIHEDRRAGVLQAPVRVVLVARDERSWFDRARTRCGNLGKLIKHRITLDDLDLNHDADRKKHTEAVKARHAEAAYTAFCDAFNLPIESRPAFAPAEAHGLDQPLLIHTAALLAAWRQHGAEVQTAPLAPSAVPQFTDQGLLLDDLIEAEVKRLRLIRPKGTTTPGELVFGSDSEVREGLCVTTLTAPVRSHLPELLACTEAFGPNGNTNRVPAADTLLDCFHHDKDAEGTARSAQRVAPVEPDLIAAHLLDRTPGRSELIEQLVASDIVAKHPAYRAQLIGILALASRDYPEIGADLRAHLADSLADLIDANETGHDSLAELLASRLDSLVTAAVAAATAQDLTAARQLAAALEIPAGDRSEHIDQAAARVYRKLPYPHPGLAGLGVALSRRALAHAEHGDKTDLIATAAAAYGTWLGVHGQRAEALAAAQRATGLYKELAAGDRAAHLPDLAMSLNNLAVRLGEVGRREEGLAAAQRAVGLREELAADNRAAHLPDLAVSVNNLAVDLAAAGLREEALAAAQRAVDLREELAADNRAAHLPDLAVSLNNLAVNLAETGRREEALAAAQRAVDLREELATDNRTAHLPNLAASVNNLAIRLGEVGRREEGLAAAQRAVDLREELAAGNRAAYLPALAGSVNNLAVDLAAAGLREEALAAAQRAVDLREELAADNRAAHLPDLAGSYWTAAHVRDVIGVELIAGVVWCDKAIVLFRELAAAEPGAFAGKLAAVEALRAKLKARLDGDGTAD